MSRDAGGRLSERQVVVVTGASAGVGRAIAHAFGARGASVGLIARGRAGLEGARSEIEAAGGRALAVPTDVADATAVERAATDIEAAFGPIDVWVNDAITSIMVRAVDADPAEFRRVTEVTYLGAVWGTQAALRRMLPRDRGVIVQVGSAVSYRAIPLQSAYSGAKFALRGFTDSVRTELHHERSNVRITMVQLPAMDTPQFDWLRSHLRFRARPLPPIFEPEVAAAAVLHAADHPRRELFVGGRATAGVGAQVVAPGLMDRFLGATAVGGQQTEEPEDPERGSNLWQPMDDAADHGARGRFDALAHERSIHLWLNTRRELLIGIAALSLFVGAAVPLRRRRKR